MIETFYYVRPDYKSLRLRLHLEIQLFALSHQWCSFLLPPVILEASLISNMIVNKDNHFFLKIPLRRYDNYRISTLLLVSQRTAKSFLINAVKTRCLKHNVELPLGINWHPSSSIFMAIFCCHWVGFTLIKRAIIGGKKLLRTSWW